jgi:hypothetical protein
VDLTEKFDSDYVWHAPRDRGEGSKEDREDVYSMLAVVLRGEEHQWGRRSGMGVIVLFSQSGVQV